MKDASSLLQQIAQLQDQLQIANDRMLALKEQRDEANDRLAIVGATLTAAQRKIGELEQRRATAIAPMPEAQAPDPAPPPGSPLPNGSAAAEAVH